MTIRVYSSLDTGAPALPSVSSQRLFDNLRLVLLACLVNGYAGRPAAGWTVIHDVADGFSLSNGEGVINLVAVSNQAVAVYLMEAVTDPSTALAGGVNRRSGPWYEGQSVTGRQFFYLPAFASTAANKGWVLVADAHSVTLSLQGSSTAVDMGTGNAGMLHFGRYYPALGGVGFIALGGRVGSTAAPDFFKSNSMGTSLRNPYTGAADQGVEPNYWPAVPVDSSATASARARFQPRVMRLVRLGVMGHGVGVSLSASQPAYAGTLRGLVGDPTLSETRLSQVLPALGVSSPTGADRLRALTVGGRSFVPLYPANELGAFVSLDAADWEPLWTV